MNKPSNQVGDIANPTEKLTTPLDTQPFILLTGLAVDGMAGVSRDYTQKAEKYIVVVTRPGETNNVKHMIENEVKLKPENNKTIDRSAFDKKYGVNSLVYLMKDKKELQNEDKFGVIDTYDLSMPGIQQIIHKALGIQPVAMGLPG